MQLISLFSKPSRCHRGRWPLDLPLIRFTNRKEDIWDLASAFQSVLIVGENGSGKTSGSGALLARRYLEAGFGGLVLCFKTDEADRWRGYLKAAGREADGRFFGVDTPYRFNFLDYEAKQAGVDFTENLVSLLVDIASINRGPAGGSEAHFWLPQKKKLLRNALGLLQLAGERIDLGKLYKLITSAPKTPEQALDINWQSKSWLFWLLNMARPCYETIQIINYWMEEVPAIPSKTRETIFADFTGMFDPLTRGKIGELFGTETNLSPDEILDGKIVVVDIPVARYREIGQYSALIWTQLFQRAVDRRTYNPPHDRPVFLWADEAHYFAIDQDAEFQTTARSKGISVVRLTQNIPNFLSAYANNKNKVDTLLGNHATKIFHRNSDPVTNEWASRVIAKETRYRTSVSIGDRNQVQNSLTETEEDSCPPKEFVGLKNGGDKNANTVEGIVFQSGRLWDKDKRWITAEFKQSTAP